MDTDSRSADDSSGSSHPRLWDLLARLPNTHHPAEPLRALDAGCGADDALSQYLEHTGNPYTLLCLDRNYKSLKLARQNSTPGGTVLAVQCDLTALPVAQGHALFDLVLIRHSDVHRSGSAWQHFISTLPILLPSHGFVVATTYSADEYNVLCGWFAATAFTRYSLDVRQLPAPDLVGRDRFVAVFQP